jgi:hypothetical protein
MYLPKVSQRWVLLDQVEVLDCLTKVGVILDTTLTNKLNDVGV